ncbi:hypothetical protein SAMN06295967_101209 [Belliella buryatensis]|uniref:Glutathione synthetase, ATP-grasp domain n=1 Tax=Belliella buryatensis TaxID=1500549 RepID=A0A239AKA8_9BACT|nr:glutathione synthetase [Belliella buryatensis]SNR95811.1 hypothetical protein SAMN06295967_101209 [Belliella buryatensis]
MSKIAVITYEARGSYAASTVADEDELLKEILTSEGYDFDFQVWSDPMVNWEKYNKILLKSPWDYFDRYEEFLKWCDHIRTLGIPVLNSIETVIWNSDKRYLQELEEKGFPIVPTEFLSKGTAAEEVRACFETFDTAHLIMKPVISGGSKHTLKLSISTWDRWEEEVGLLLKDEDFMIQPFVEEIVKVGEYSYLFFNGGFSHAVLKIAKEGDFRVQHFFGGQIALVQPTSEQLAYLKPLVDTFAKDTLYARVDGVWRGEEFLLMELELIEPYLFLFTSEVAKANYVQALKERLG